MPTTSYAQGVGRVMPHDCIISAYAGSLQLCAVLDTWAQKPGFIEWPGEVPPGGKGHPSWTTVAQRLRDPMSGRLLPRLIGRFYAGMPVRLAVIGFSAGSNSGLRELLRHPEDRAAISFVGSFDGLHAAVQQNRALWSATDPRTWFVDWKGQVAPIADYAVSAASGNQVCVITANNLQEPIAGVARTPFQMNAIWSYVMNQVGNQGPAGASVLQDFLARKNPDYVIGGLTKCSWGTPPSMAMVRSVQNQYQRPYPTAKVATSNGRFFAINYDRNLEKPEHDHIDQGGRVLVNAIDAFLAPLWGITRKAPEA